MRKYFLLIVLLLFGCTKESKVVSTIVEPFELEQQLSVELHTMKSVLGDVRFILNNGDTDVHVEDSVIYVHNIARMLRQTPVRLVDKLIYDELFHFSFYNDPKTVFYIYKGETEYYLVVTDEGRFYQSDALSGELMGSVHRLGLRFHRRTFDPVVLKEMDNVTLYKYEIDQNTLTEAVSVGLYFESECFEVEDEDYIECGAYESIVLYSSYPTWYFFVEVGSSVYAIDEIADILTTDEILELVRGVDGILIEHISIE